MKIEINIRKEHLILLIGIIILTPALAAIVSHDASQIQSGILGLIYDGNWSFMNGSIGIGTLFPTQTLTVIGDLNVTGTIIGFGEQGNNTLLGEWNDTVQFNTTYKAETDGFVMVRVQASGTDAYVYALGYTDNNDPPTTQRGRASGRRISGTEYDMGDSFLMPVKQEDYWNVTLGGGGTTVSKIYWIPINRTIGGITASTGGGTTQCPSGFTKISNAGYELGCIQTDQVGSANCTFAAAYCFDNYGGRLPSYSEAYISFINYDLLNEGKEWVDSALYTTDGGIAGNACGMVGTAVTDFMPTADDYNDGVNVEFRCFIPAQGNNQGTGASPAFNVNLGEISQTAASGWTYVNWTNIIFDTNNDFNISNGTFRPTVAGKYLLTAAAGLLSVDSDKYMITAIKKNGVFIALGSQLETAQAGTTSRSVVTTVTDAEPGDYFEVYVYNEDIASKTISGSSSGTYFAGSRIDGGNGYWTKQNDTMIIYDGDVNVTGDIYTSSSSLHIGNQSLTNDAGILKWEGTKVIGTLDCTTKSTAAGDSGNRIIECDTGYEPTGCATYDARGDVTDTHPYGNGCQCVSNDDACYQLHVFCCRII